MMHFIKQYFAVHILLFQILTTVSEATREDLLAGIIRLSSDVIHLRNEIESAISNRCDSIRGCYRSSYDECQSEYTTNQFCPSLKQIGLAISECGTGINCNGLFDDAITTVRLPANLANGPDGNPTNPEVIEAVCYTKSAERWMVKYSQQSKDFYKSLGVNSPQMYFGSSTGVSRIFPARQSRECGMYDPRQRPWYQAALPTTISNTVKPGRVVIILDTSRSMNETISKSLLPPSETKLSFAKKSAIATINTLSDRAYISVIRFGEEAMPIGRKGSSPPFLWQKATKSHKKMLIDELGPLTTRGRSNWVSGFDFAFKVIENSLKYIEAKDNATSCELENIALLFFSDGEYNLPAGVTDKEIVDVVSDHVKVIEGMGDYHIFPFFYSLGNSDMNHVSKELSCAVDGYWIPVKEGDTITPANLTMDYQALFSIPLGTNSFYNYTRWSGPYTFASGGDLGYTVTGAVYNRDVEPPIFMGTAAMDIPAAAAMKLYGQGMNRTVTIDETIAVVNEIIDNIELTEYNTTCEQQHINLTYCETQSLRHLYAGNAAICIPPDADLSDTDEEELLTDPGSLLTLDMSNVSPSPNTTNATSSSNMTDIDPDALTDDEKDEVIFEDILNCSKGFVKQCAGYDEYPQNLWTNVEMKGLPYEERVCCKVGTDTTSADCPKLDEIPDTKIPTAAVFGMFFGGVLLVEIVCCVYCFYYRKRRRLQAE